MFALLMCGSFILALINTVVVSGLVVMYIKDFLGETPLSRLLRVVGGIVSCGLYGYFAIYKTAEFWFSNNVSPIGMIILLLLPLLLVAIIYIVNGNGNNT